MDPFVHLPANRVVICSVCRFACVANEVATHLRTRHRDISPAKRQNIVEAVEQTHNIIRSQAELIGFQFPEPTTEPIRFLEPPKPDGLKCLLCPYISRHLQKIQAHCRINHGWKNQRKRGRLAVTKSLRDCEVLWTTGVKCQRFFRSRVASGWFEVGRSVQPGHGWVEPEVRCRSSLLMAECQARIGLQAEDYLVGGETCIAANNYPHLRGGALEGKTFVATRPLVDHAGLGSMYQDICGHGSRVTNDFSVYCFLSADYLFGQEIQPW